MTAASRKSTDYDDNPHRSWLQISPRPQNRIQFDGIEKVGFGLMTEIQQVLAHHIEPDEGQKYALTDIL